MKKKLIVVILLALIIAAAYAGGFFYFQNRFLPQTALNGIDVSYKNKEEAALAMEEYDPFITVTERTVTGECIDENISLKSLYNEPLEYPLDELINNQQKGLWFVSLFRKNEITSKKILNAACNEEKLKEAAAALYCMQEENITEPQDAHIELSEGTLAIIEEDDGCLIKEETVIQALKEGLNAFAQGENEGNINLTDLYEEAAVKKDDPKLTGALEEMQKVLSKTVTIVYKSGKSTELSGEDLLALLNFEDSQLTVNEEAVGEYATKKSNENSVSKYEYIDGSALKNALLDALLSAEDSSVQAKWVYVTKKLVEVDISEQTLWYYENDELIFSSPVVTGNASMGCGTPTGTYYVRRKVTDSTLRGSDYTEHVDYWIGWDSTGRIYGFHDASWRDSFGGDIYLSDPSHGCVNMPLDKVAKLYESVDIGTEVYIHN